MELQQFKLVSRQ